VKRGSHAGKIRGSFDWGELAPLRLRARQIAEGIYAGAHRSMLHGAGVEFGGYREYVAGDDLRRLDRRSLLRHGRLVVRQFETETERSLCLLVDASASMAFRSAAAPAAKLAFAALVASALTRVAIATGDPVSVTFVGGVDAASIGPSGGREQFERIVSAFESMGAGGDVYADPAMLDRALGVVGRIARRGALVIVLSDLLDWPSGAAERLALLATRGRVLCVVQILDPAEAGFPYSGTVLFRALEGQHVVETDPDVTRDQYLGNLAELTGEWRGAVVRRGGRFLSTTTSSRPAAVVGEIVRAIR
jgi:uncharacterized protein (DUF58 family)